MANAPVDPKLPILQRDHRSVMGKVLYTSKKPDRLNQERGREYFRIDVHADGTRTCTAHCEIDDRPSVMRDITYSLDADWMPTDCFVRLSVGSKFMGSGWFRFHPQYAECETWTSLEGRVSQRMDIATPLLTFQNHAIACDAWHLRLIDQKKTRCGAAHSADAAVLARPPWCDRTDALFDWPQHRFRRPGESYRRRRNVRCTALSVRREPRTASGTSAL